jgi:hypothetical protein
MRSVPFGSSFTHYKSRYKFFFAFACAIPHAHPKASLHAGGDYARFPIGSVFPLVRFLFFTKIIELLAYKLDYIFFTRKCFQTTAPVSGRPVP